MNTEKIIQTLIKFKAEMFMDEFLGIFEKVPHSTKEALETQFQEALKQTSEKLSIPMIDLIEDVESQAISMVNGTSFSQDFINYRLEQYGIQKP